MKRKSARKSPAFFIAFSIVVLLVIAGIAGIVSPSATERATPVAEVPTNTPEPDFTNTPEPAPTYTPLPAYPAPTKPAYPAPAYPAPTKPAYPAPTERAYPAPTEPAYPAPTEPAYPAPTEPGQVTGEQKVWRVVENVDINNDGVDEFLVFRGTDIVPSPKFSDPAYDYYQVLASEFAILHQGVKNTPTEWLLKVTPERVTANGETLMSFVVPKKGNFIAPAAFLIGYSMENDAQITIIPLDKEGKRYMQNIGFSWDEEAQQYRLILWMKMPTVEPAAEPADTSIDK
jgi:hypothetical protein